MNKYDIKSLVADIAAQAQTGPSLDGSGTLQKNSLSPHFERFILQRQRALMIKVGQDVETAVGEEIIKIAPVLQGEPEKIKEFLRLLIANVAQPIRKIYSDENFN